MDDKDMKQLCLDLSNASLKLFDLIDAKGIDAPLETMENVFVFGTVINKYREIADYYERRNIQRMLALGVSPATLLERARRNNNE